MFGRAILLYGEHAQANGKLKNEWKKYIENGQVILQLTFLWQTTNTTRVECKKQIDDSSRDKWKINVYENDFEMIVSCGSSSTMGARSYMLFCSTQENSFFYGSTVQVGPGHISGEVSRTHSDTPHSVGWVIGPSQRSVPDNTQVTSHKRHSCPRWDSNPQFRHSSDHRTTP